MSELLVTLRRFFRASLQFLAGVALAAATSTYALRVILERATARPAALVRLDSAIVAATPAAHAASAEPSDRLRRLVAERRDLEVQLSGSHDTVLVWFAGIAFLVVATVLIGGPTLVDRVRRRVAATD